MTNWYYSDHQRQRHGPVSNDELAELHAAGQLQPDTLVWREGFSEWKPWREVMADVVPGATPAATSPSGGGGWNPADFTAAYNASASTATPVSEPNSPYAPPRATLSDHNDYQDGGEIVYAGFWKRAAALFIDSLIVTIAYYAVVIAVVMALGVGMGAFMTNQSPDGLGTGLIAMMALIYLSYPVISGLYYIGFESSSKQATLGKMAVGIKVADRDGRRLSRGHTLGRWASHLLCYFTLYIGYLVAAFTQRKQGLHDMVAGTLVVDQWAYTAHPERQRRELGGVALAVLIVVGGLYALMISAILLAIALPAYQQYLQRAGGG